MSKIFDLINELCPDGVEFRELGDVCDTVTDFNAAGSFASLRKNAKYLKQSDFAQLIRTTDLKSEFTKGDFVYVSQNSFNFLWRVNLNQPSIILPNVGNCGEVYYVEPKDLPHKNNVLGPNAILVRSSIVENKFLKHVFLSEKFQSELKKITTTIGQTKFNKTDLKKIKLPVPPMEVQREIVRILDSFTLLTAELTARKKQYEFYRDFLLNFNEDQSEIKWDIIDNIFIMKNGYTPSKANKDFWENGTISWYRMEDIRENGRILSESIQKITPQAVKGGKLIPKNSIIVATTATIGEHALAIADSFLMNQQFTSFTIRELLKDKLDIKFVFYYFFKICEWCKQNTNSSSFPSVDMAKLKKVKFPIPSLQTQQKVVDILDKFDTLVNSITDGLPREIELRHKQYEHYRELLLNFKSKMTA